MVEYLIAKWNLGEVLIFTRPSDFYKIFERQHAPLALFKFPGRSISSFSKRNIKNIISFVLVPINRYTPEVQREDGNTRKVDSTVDISWDSGGIGVLDEEVSIDLACYKMGHDDIFVLDSFREVVNNQLSSGHSRFTITKGEGDG